MEGCCPARRYTIDRGWRPPELSLQVSVEVRSGRDCRKEISYGRRAVRRDRPKELAGNPLLPGLWTTGILSPLVITKAIYDV